MAELRMPAVNRVIISGRLTRDPDLRYTPSGAAVCTFRIASSQRYKDRSTGEWKERVTYVNVVAWRELAERLGERLKRGSAVFVEGALQSRSWETEDGQKRSAMEIRAFTTQILDKLAPPGEEPVPAEEEEEEEEEEEGGEREDLPF